MKKVLLLIIFNVCVLGIYAQKTEFTLTLKDGNMVTGEAKISSVLLTTDYGKLNIPIQNVSSIELGLHRDDSKKDEITNLAKQLLNSSEEIRSKAYSSLVALNPSSIPVLEDIIYEGTYEPSNFNDYTLSSALNELKQSFQSVDLTEHGMRALMQSIFFLFSASQLMENKHSLASCYIVSKLKNNTARYLGSLHKKIAFQEILDRIYFC